MHFERAGNVLIEDTFGGGFQNARGGTYLYILDSGATTLIGSQTESMTNSIVYHETSIPGGGDYSYPMTIINSTFGDPIIFNARRTLVSTGNVFGPKTFQADERLRPRDGCFYDRRNRRRDGSGASDRLRNRRSIRNARADAVVFTNRLTGRKSERNDDLLFKLSPQHYTVSGRRNGRARDGRQ